MRRRVSRGHTVNAESQKGLEVRPLRQVALALHVVDVAGSGLFARREMLAGRRRLVPEPCHQTPTLDVADETLAQLDKREAIVPWLGER